MSTITENIASDYKAKTEDLVTEGSNRFAAALDTRISNILSLPGFENLIPGIDLIPDSLSDIIGGGTDAIIGVFDKIIADLGGTLTPDGILNEFVPDALKPLLDIPDPTTGITPKELFSESFRTGQTEQAISQLVPFTGIDITDQAQVDQVTEGLTSAFDLITITRSGSVLIDRSTLALPPAYDIKSTYGSDNPGYTYIPTVEELELELRTVQREITEVIVHWTETYTNANMDADQIEDMATTLGATSMPYHYVIKRDGSLQRGAPVGTTAEHCQELGHNDYSISIIFVGGLNVATGVTNDDEFTQAAALTMSQYNTFHHFMRVFFDIWPGGQALGHRDIVPERTDPGFDVREYCKNAFGKTSLYLDPAADSALSVDDIINYVRPARGTTTRTGLDENSLSVYL